MHLVGADPSLPTVLRLLYNVLCLDAAAGVNADAAQSADISLATLLAFGGDELINATHSLTASREVARVPLRADLSDADRLALARLVFQPLQVELAEPTTVLQAVTQLRLTPADLATLFITWWGALPYTSLLRIGLLHAAAVFVIHFAAHLRQEQRLLSGNADAKTAAASPLWHACLTFCTNSSRLVHACLLARMLAAVPVGC